MAKITAIRCDQSLVLRERWIGIGKVLAKGSGR
jgi:hypothetical protein